MGWLVSDDKPPVLDSIEGATTYPPPSAAATPTALGESKATAAAPGSNVGATTAGVEIPPGYPSTAYPTVAQTGSTPPAAAAVPRSMPNSLKSDTTAPSVARANTAAAPSTRTSAGAPNQDAFVATPTAPRSSAPPIGLPPGVTAPNLTSTVAGGRSAANVQQGLYSLNQPSPSAPSTAVATAPGNDYPMPDSGTATTWDYPVQTPTATAPGNHVAANAASGDFTPVPGSNGQPSTAAIGVQPIETVARDGPSSAQASHTATASHYESIATRQALSVNSGPWRPGSTSSYESAVAASGTVPASGQGVQPSSTAQLPGGGSSTRASGFE